MTLPSYQKLFLHVRNWWNCHLTKNSSFTSETGETALLLPKMLLSHQKLVKLPSYQKFFLHVRNWWHCPLTKNSSFTSEIGETPLLPKISPSRQKLVKLPSYQKFFLQINRKGIYFKWVRLKSGKAEFKQSVQVRLPNILIVATG